MAEFRSDLETFLLREVVDAAVRSGPLELPFNQVHKYTAFADPTGGGAAAPPMNPLLLIPGQ